MHSLAGIQALSDWQAKRGTIESSVMGVIGKMPKDVVDPQMKVVDELTLPGMVRRRINYFVDEWSRISAWMFVPDGAEDAPAVLCLHRMIAMGKDEPARMDGADPSLAFAHRYAQQGFVTLAPDTIAAGERIYSRLSAFDTKSFYKENSKLSALGKMLWDHQRALDVLSECEEVDPGRIGAIGHGLGGTNAMMLAALDDRVHACVLSCAFALLEKDENPERWTDNAGLRLLPKLEDAAKSGKYPFDWDEILALIAPNPTLVLAALNDDEISHPETAKTAVERAQKVYKLLGSAKAIDVHTHREGHAMSALGLDLADEWFSRWL